MNEVCIVSLHGRLPAVMGENRLSADGSCPDGAGGGWTQQLSNPGTETEPSEPRSRASVLQGSHKFLPMNFQNISIMVYSISMTLFK